MFYNRYMSIEVEIKAWVRDFKEIKSKLDSKYDYIGDYEKEDVYLKGIDSITDEEREIRLRREGGNSIVTYKDRSHQGKVEVNVEKEFLVDKPNEFLFTMEKLGFVPYIRKNKKGYKYKSGSIVIELSHVEKLGDFIEIEYIVSRELEVDLAKEEIFKILDSLGIDRDEIEDKFYVQMLLDLNR